MKKILIFIVIFCLGGLAFWAFSPLFIDKEVNDELDPGLKARLEAQRLVDEARERQSESDEETSKPDSAELKTENNNLKSDTEIESTILVEGPFEIIGTTGHPASGQIEIIRSPEETLIQYKNYDGTNGPDLKIYLAKDLEVNEFIDLGDARGNKGNIIYGAPLDIDFEEYPYILTWCESFGVLFDYAKVE